jgi:hypothetical protein
MSCCCTFHLKDSNKFNLLYKTRLILICLLLGSFSGGGDWLTLGYMEDILGLVFNHKLTSTKLKIQYSYLYIQVYWSHETLKTQLHITNDMYIYIGTCTCTFIEKITQYHSLNIEITVLYFKLCWRQFVVSPSQIEFNKWFLVK